MFCQIHAKDLELPIKTTALTLLPSLLSYHIVLAHLADRMKTIKTFNMFSVNCCSTHLTKRQHGTY